MSVAVLLPLGTETDVRVVASYRLLPESFFDVTESSSESSLQGTAHFATGAVATEAATNENLHHLN